MGNFSRLRTNIWKTEDGETLGSLSIIKEKRRRRAGVRDGGQINLFVAVVLLSPVRVRPQCQRANGRTARHSAGAESASAFVLARPSALFHDSTADLAPSDGGEVEDKEL